MKDSKIKNKWAFFIILVISSIVYFNSCGNSFQYDDKFYIRDNFYIRDIGNIPGAFLHPSYLAVGFPTGHYRPLLFASYAFNYYLSGLNPTGYRMINLAFHVGSAFLVFLIVRAMSGGSTEGVAAGFSLRPKPLSPVTSLGRRLKPAATGYLLPTTYFAALAAALIFAVHPFNSEVVNYISTRSSVMSGFFYLVAFWCWVRYRTPPPFPPPQGGRVREGVYFYITSLFAFLLGMLTKETVITLPVVLWLYDMYFYRPSRRPQAKACGYLPAATATLVRYAKGSIVYLPFVTIIAGAYFAVRFFYWGSFLPYLKRDLMTQFYTEMPVLTKYIRLLFIPAGLNADHYVTIYSRPALPVIGSFLFLILVIATGVWLFKSKRIEWRVVSFFIFWFFIVLLPTTIMPLNAILQENRAHLAGIGFAVSMGVFIWQGSGVVAGLSLRPKSGVRSQIYIALILILIIIFSIMTVQRNTVWRNGLTLWEDAVSKSPLSPVAHHNLAYYYEEEGKVRLAIQEYQRVVELDPSHAMSYYNLGRLYRGLGVTKEAVASYQSAVSINPDYYRAYNNLGIIYDDMGMHDLAIEEFKKAIKINPGYVMARMNLGKMYEKIGRMDLAASEFAMVIKLARPGSGEEKKASEAAKHLEWIRGREGSSKQ